MPSGQYGVFGDVGIRTLRNIRQVYEVTKELIRAQLKQQDLTLGKADAEHLDQIQSLIQKWSNSFDVRHRSADAYVLPPRYGVEHDKLFPYALVHCPSVNDEYQALLNKRSDYKIQSSELKKSQAGQWQQAFIEMEGKLRDTLEMCLLSHEYSRHRCALCSPSSK